MPRMAIAQVPIDARDYFVVQGIVLLLSISIAVAMLVMDLVYPLIDPRIGTEKKS